MQRDGGHVQDQRPHTQLSWKLADQPTANGNAQSKRPSSHLRRERCCNICGFFFYEIWGIDDPTSTTPGEKRQGGVKRSGTETPRSHQLPLNWNFGLQDRRTREANTPQRETEQKLPGLQNTTKRWLISRRALSRDRGTVGTTPTRTSPCARGPPPLHMAFLPPRRVSLDLT